MKIKRLEIIGFKSFVDKVSLDFQEGITAVVGPNGCGKSNVVDAIRWAMGEQNAKQLRGRSMEDVIFGGSESRKPLGMAEVSLFFSNDDGLAPPAFREYAEIMVTRRLHRSGESEFLINKTPCRLKDISELFMDTGVGARAYSIIEQGKIGMILSAKPEDRRFLIEEAAGVTKYKSRKKTALRKIEATRQNLLRLGDIISEVRRQLGGLKRQAQKAQRYREYREELKGIEIRFAGRRYAEVMQEVRAAAAGESEQSGLLERCRGQLEQGDLRTEELRLVHASVERELTQAQERVFHLSSSIQQVEGKIDFSGKERENLGRQQERLVVEAGEVTRRLAEIDREEKSLRADVAALNEEIAASERNLQEGEAALEEQLAAEQDGAAQLEETRSRLFALLNELSRFGSLYDEAFRRLQTLDERVARNRREAVSVREAFEAVQTEIGDLETSLGRLDDEDRELRNAEDEARERLHALRGRLERAESALLTCSEETGRHRSRLESLQELARTFEGYAGGVKALLQAPALNGRLRGLVADALEAPAEYEAAFEAVLGERLQAVLVDGQEDALAALTVLRDQGGRGTLLLPGREPSPVHFAGGV
ncbi:MAG TPA: chromosome segregation protein SMC, partial [Desulfuromonadales bacterium]|nr:chromosome segregation protein SMC [Desulfuromonadales bacterium]